MTSFIPANDATGWGDTFRAGLLVGHDVNGHTVDALTVYNVEKYGAVGDGTTNDTTACQNAPYWSSNNATVTVASGASNVTLWDEAGFTASVTDSSGGQFKKIRSYLLTGG